MCVCVCEVCANLKYICDELPERHGFGQLLSLDEKVRKYILEDILTDTVIRHLRNTEAFVVANIAAMYTSQEAISNVSGHVHVVSHRRCGAWMAGTPAPTIADFTLIPRIKQLQSFIESEMDFDVMAIFPKLQELVQCFYELPEIKKYYITSGTSMI